MFISNAVLVVVLYYSKFYAYVLFSSSVPPHLQFTHGDERCINVLLKFSVSYNLIYPR